MNHHLNKAIFFALLLITFYSQTQAATDTTSTKTHDNILLSTSLLAQLTWNLELYSTHVYNFRQENGTFEWYIPTTLFAQNIPLYAKDWKTALAITGLQLGIFTSGTILNERNYYTNFSSQYNFLFTTMYSSYALYQNTLVKNRGIASTQESMISLAIAPFKGKIFLHPANLISIGSSAAILSASYLFSNKSQSLWNSKTFYMNGREISPGLGLGLQTATMLSHNFSKGFEESFWRGMVYEEMKYQWGDNLLPKIGNSALFALWHISPELTEGNVPVSQIPYVVLAVFAGGLVLTYVYDNAGLEVTSACHAWFNTTMGILNFVYFGGDKNFALQKTQQQNQHLNKTVGIVIPIALR